MRKLFTASAFALVLGFGSLAAQSGTPATISLTPAPAGAEQTVPLTTIKFDEPEFNFGTIKEGEVLEHTFTFTNSGANPLILESVKPSCGCTSLDYSKEPIAPGKTGTVKIQFNSTGKGGDQMKFITITYNGNPNIERVSFKGHVEPKPVPANPVNPGQTEGAH